MEGFSLLILQFPISKCWVLMLCWFGHPHTQQYPIIPNKCPTMLGLVGRNVALIRPRLCVFNMQHLFLMCSIELIGDYILHSIRVQIHDSYKFVSKSYHSMKYHFKSIDTWLHGICRRSVLFAACSVFNSL